jgi:hypothetical protein
MKNFILLLKELKKTLAGAGKLLTIAVGATETSASQSYDIPSVAATVDFINLMTYDLHGTWDAKTGINAPLHAGSDTNKQLNVEACVNYWLSKGCPADKLVIGIPLYGRSFTLANPASYQINAQIRGGGKAGQYTRQSGFLGYNEICMFLKSGWKREWESSQMVPFAHQGDQWVGYDDVESIKKKMEFMKQKNLGGVMFWSIETDDFKNTCGAGNYPLLKAAKSAMAELYENYETSVVDVDPMGDLIGQSLWKIPEMIAKFRIQMMIQDIPLNDIMAESSDEIYYQCSVDGIFKHPRDNQKYFICVSQNAQEHSCDDGKAFNSNTLSCEKIITMSYVI